MKKYWNLFLKFVEEKKKFFIWFFVCFVVDRITTYIVLTQGWFGESNSTALLMWNSLGYVSSELLMILLVIVIFFYVGVWGSDLVKKYVLPGICLIYSYMMLSNIVAIILGVTGNLEVMKYIGSQSSDLWEWYVYCFVLSIISFVVIFLFDKMKGRKKI